MNRASRRALRPLRQRAVLDHLKDERRAGYDLPPLGRAARRVVERTEARVARADAGIWKGAIRR